VVEIEWFCVRRRGAVLFALSIALAGCSASAPPTGDTAAAQYDPASGRLRRLAFDTTRNGRHDAVGIMDGTRVERIEVDENEDGKVDRWEFYDVNRRLERVGFSRQGDGVMDAVAFYESGAVARIEMSTHGDGRFNRVEFYRSESLLRVEEDTNGDGRVDKWETYALDSRATPGQRSSIVMAAFDDHARGTPSRRLVYRPDGSVLRVETDLDGDGIFSDTSAATPPK
jgi:hypothetical protein